MSLINTGGEDIYANMPVYWDVPEIKSNSTASKVKTSECGDIKGHPEGIIYPATRMLKDEDEVTELSKITSGDKAEIRKVLSKRRRVIGWSMNHAKPGEQLDLIIKR